MRGFMRAAVARARQKHKPTLHFHNGNCARLPWSSDAGKSSSCWWLHCKTSYTTKTNRWDRIVSFKTINSSRLISQEISFLYLLIKIVDETHLVSSFVWDFPSQTWGWKVGNLNFSGSACWDQFDLAAGIKHPAGYASRLGGSCPEHLDRPPTTNKSLSLEFLFWGIGVNLAGVPATTVSHRQIGMEDHWKP